MSRLLWGAVALLGVTVAVALAAAGSGGSVPEKALAHIITPTGTPGPPLFHAEIDADAWNGTSPCNPVDTSAEVAIGATNDIAVCLTDAMAPVQPPDPNANGVATFQFDVLYDPDLNSCVDKNCNQASPCTEDDMPDLNEGATLGQGVPTNPDIGGGWDCLYSYWGFIEPSCAGGRARIRCSTIAGPFPATGPGVAFPIFAVTFTANAVGVDNMTLANGFTYDALGFALGSCNPTFHGEAALLCIGATVNVHDWTPTPTPTPTPTATPTPGGAVGGIAEPPDIESRAAASGPGVSVAGAAAAVTAGAGLLVIAGAWYARRRRRAG